MNLTLDNTQAGIIGLGYVGMPLALMLSNNVDTIGFDTNAKRINDLNNNTDSNNEIESIDLEQSKCVFTNNPNDLKACNVFIVTVPTPLDNNNAPDLSAVKTASKMLAGYLNKGDIVVYESTVYPGVTEDICGPILEDGSGLICGKDFYLGYSPERINPGDKVHTVDNITKVVSGQTPEITDYLATLYGSVNNNNIFKAKNIKTAEASKAIENAQRDINVAFVNEVTMILDKLNLSSYDVLEAASTKWNFLGFHPGLVGGHCIGVDPYYLAYCAKEVGCEPDVILSGRKTNDAMGLFVADKINNLLTARASNDTEHQKVLILGFTFKENINDIRNTKVIDVFNALKKKGHNVDVHDPHAYLDEVHEYYGLTLLDERPQIADYDAVVLAVSHDDYQNMSQNDVTNLLSENGFVFDLRGIWRTIGLAEKNKYYSL